MRSVNRTMLVAPCIRPHRPGRRLTAALMVLTVGGTADASTPASTPTATVEPSEAQPTSEQPNSVTTIRVTVAGQSVTAGLTDNPTAQDLAHSCPSP